MEIQPNTTIRILQNVPLDTTYKHTIYFASASAQTSYFSGKTKYTLTEQSYQRVERGMMRVQLKADNLYNCNYLMFQNTSFGTKWFYAFITGVEYINNEVAEVTFELDVMQTWFFDVTLKQSYVEREHSKTDVAGDNRIAEPVEVGGYYNTMPTGTKKFNSYGAILVCPYRQGKDLIGNYKWFNVQENFPIAPNKIDGQLTSLYYTVLKTPKQIGYALYQLNDQGLGEEIVAIYPVPTEFIKNYNTDSYDDGPFDILTGNTQVYTYNYYEEGKKPTTLGSYTPVNKKLLTYPYNKFVIETGDGGSHEYAFEDFEKGVSFGIWGTLLHNMCFCAFPVYYKGANNNYSENVLLTDFPMMGYTTDTFKAWLAQNKGRIAVQGATTLASTFTGVGAGMAMIETGQQMLTPKTKVISKRGSKMMQKGYEKMGEVSGAGVAGVAGSIADIMSHAVGRYQMAGNTDGSIGIAMGTKDFRGSQVYVQESYAKAIDDFFTVYGYATKRVKVPNRNVRPHWTYTKTIDCNLIGNAPADDVAKICSIYDHGITFWRNGNEVGNYSLDNKPV